MKTLRLVGCAALLFTASIASAHTKIYTTSMSGPNEFPSNSSPGTGSAVVTVDTDTLTMRVQANFSGLLGAVSAAHIHGPIPLVGDPLASVATTSPSFTGFPTGVKSGVYDHTYDLTQASTFHPNFITNNGGSVGNAMNAFINFMDAGRMYFNIHTQPVQTDPAPTGFPGGEIRGFMQLVPEPSALALGGIGMLALMARRRRAC